MMWARQTLPVDCKIADQPTVALVDRLGGSNRAASVNANFVAMAAPAASGKTQITTRRRSTGALVPITPANATTSYRAPVLTSDDMVLFDSDGDGRMMYAPAAGGAIWPVDPLSLIDCWGDSLTAGAGSNGSGAGQGPWPKQLADRLAPSYRRSTTGAWAARTRPRSKRAMAARLRCSPSPATRSRQVARLR
jgi:hypothetical protein